MAHCRLLFVGGRDNLDKIFEACPDSSSETAAEMTIGADWVEDWDWLDKEEKERRRTTDNFTKEDKELYKEILDGRWYDCYDVRDPNRYGDFCCLNCPDWESETGSDWKDKEKRNKERIIEAIKKLPDDTLFHFADSHW